MNGKLYICATPIGNLEDITLRTLNVLKEVDIIAAEDTRRTIRLLNHYGISKPLMSYHEHNKFSKGSEMIAKLLEGQNIALVSDAGMPGISDPGEDAVRLAIENGIEVEVLPGASAFVTALVGSGLPTGRFLFFGFLSRDKKERRAQLEELRYEKATVILYEAPHRLLHTLSDMLEGLGNRRVCISRELTKLHEENIRTSLQDAIGHFSKNQPRGEFVLIVEGSKEEKKIEDDITEGMGHREYVEYLMDAQGMDKKEAIKTVAKKRGIAKNDVYKEVHDI
ncbi:ribosomal RNA small subunit methyltransferase I [Peptoclostridium acidaminophilum DSM 3953]|uniref:Ribosomal RNA small subunit methyltransferase I n=1 Tax=Peptoclostridium acidaminophilum DSM 3953 TaxID=1286171 RepID=W8U3G6_PEPAC|nr:16S rRNA (cytidine(1402)-2'-O)-methyltransferase [Peptoclostridium acidaminophilum]AHM55531.1 ribosomal RNA small subunit methyltransferase I [Peptoclostridium acidaminophilum DSM 3953]